MSLPAALTTAVASAGSAVVLNPLDSMLHLFNTNPYFIGLMMFILNVGGRFVGLEITKKQEQFFQHPWVRRGLIFTVLFVATRSIWVSFWGTLAIVLLFGYLFNEHSAFCIFGQGGVENSTCDKKVDEGMTPEEKEILHRLTAKAQRYMSANKATVSESTELSDDDIIHTDIYAANLALLRR